MTDKTQPEALRLAEIPEGEHAQPEALRGAPPSAYSQEDRAFYTFWYGHMLNEWMQPPLAEVSHSTARYIWDAAIAHVAAQPATPQADSQPAQEGKSHG